MVNNGSYCDNCGKKTHICPSKKQNKSHCCSNKCRYEYVHKMKTKKTTCDYCGKEIRRRLSAFKSHQNHFCSIVCVGKYKTKQAIKNGNTFFDQIFTYYKNQAKNRNLEFSLSKQQVKELVLQNCSYTGRKPKFKRYINRNRVFKGYRNGIDRIDSTKGYTKENCTTCCEEINRAKSDLIQEQFAQLVVDCYPWAKKFMESEIK